MIPLRVKLAGFLSYRGEQEIDFGNANLWMLAGTNGSGKSSVFDALTYALFGSHRGGSTNAVELINKESSGAAVEFDFRLEGQAYRAKRTVRRTNKGASSATQQIFREVAAGSWEAVPDTTKKVDFDKWVADKIGLTYEVFTSSVLLLQNKAERLLDARASDRAEVLASIVDLERYQKLHARANEYKLEFKNRLEAVSHRASGVPEVSDMELMAAVLEIEAKEDDRKVCQGEIETLLNLEVQCRRWLEAQSRVTAAAARLAASEGLLSDAVKIEAAFARYTELRAVLPAVSVALAMWADARESQQRTENFEKQRADTQERKRQTDAELDKVKKTRDAAARQLTSDEAELAAVNGKLRELAAGLERVRQVEVAQAELQRHEAELKRQPPDPEAGLQVAEREAERLALLARVEPVLERVHEDRQHLREATKAEARDAVALTGLEAEGKQLRKAAEGLTAELTAARLARGQAEKRAGVAAALADRAAAAAAEFESLTGAKDCPACGQELTPKHLDAERKRRHAEAAAAGKELDAARKTLAAATAAETELTAREKEATAKLGDLRERYTELKAAVAGHRAAITRLAGALKLRYPELPAAWQTRIAPLPPPDAAGWAATGFPERDELAALKQEVKTLPAAQATLTKAREALTLFGKLRARVEAARDALDKLKQGLQGIDPVALRAEHATAAGREKSLVNAVKAGKQTVAEQGTRADTLTGQAHHCVQSLTDLAGKLANELTVRKNATDNADRAKRQLPPEWQARVSTAGLGADSGWKAEAERLEADGIEAQYKGLAQARAGLENLRDALRAQEAEVAAFPPESRRDPDEVRVTLTEAKARLAAAEQAHLAALQQRGKLDDYRAQREALGTETRQLDGRFARYKTLTELLGRDRLQRYLVRRAERQIVDYANGVLDRLSGGQLFLKLAAGEETGADKALELEAYNRTTGGAPIPVAFLSGSQKFRVAVCLALGIGQYASRQHRPIESVIIDEGFGCLDRQGRQVMIQELQNLRGHLHCILLVSHQEEFADAFPDGYRFELHDGATRVSRFQR